MTIEIAKEYITALDEVFAVASVTSDLESTGAKPGMNAGEIQVPKMTLDGLGDVGAGGNLASGDVTLAYETLAFNYNRGRKFVVDQVDDINNAGILFANIGAEFVRTKVAPEADAFTFATLAGTSNISTTSGATLSTGAEVIAAVAAAADGMDNDEVPAEGRILYITPALYGLVRDLDTTKSREVFSQFEKVVKVPQGRFYTAIDMNDGTSVGETAGGYAKASGGKDINFMIVQKDCVMKFDKHVASNIITADENQAGDGFIQKYRKYALVKVPDNKVKGIYLHKKA